MTNNLSSFNCLSWQWAFQKPGKQADVVASVNQNQYFHLIFRLHMCRGEHVLGVSGRRTFRLPTDSEAMKMPNSEQPVQEVGCVTIQWSPTPGFPKQMVLKSLDLAP